jgi:hypothetical protein
MGLFLDTLLLNIIIIYVEFLNGFETLIRIGGIKLHKSEVLNLQKDCCVPAVSPYVIST